jgi:tetratricopeptide (TPR) repeat protein
LTNGLDAIDGLVSGSERAEVGSHVATERRPNAVAERGSNRLELEANDGLLHEFGVLASSELGEGLIRPLRDCTHRFRLFAALAALSATACAHEAEVEARPTTASPPPDDRCLVVPWSIAPPDPSSPRDFAAAREAFETGLAQRDDGADPTDAFAQATARDPTFGLAHLELAEALLRGVNPDLDRVGHHLARAVVLLPDNPRAHELFARHAEIEGERELAVRHYRCALDRREGLTDARYRLAVQLFELGRYGEAGAELRRLLASDPTMVSARVLFSRVLESEGRHREAAQHLETAARYSRDNPVLLRRAADLYAKAGEPAEASRLDDEADARDPPEEGRDLRPLRPSRR